MVSDGETKIDARLSTRSVRAFVETHRRDFAAGTKQSGYLLRILSFKIIATAYGDPARRISLLIYSFDFLGLPQAMIRNPSAICDIQAINDVLDRLHSIDQMELTEGYHEHESIEGDPVPASPSSVASQVFEQTSKSLEPATQLATQLPAQTKADGIHVQPKLNLLDVLAKSAHNAKGTWTSETV